MATHDNDSEPLDQRKAQDLARVARFLEKLGRAGFYGKLTIAYQNGKVIDLRTEQTMKLEDL